MSVTGWEENIENEPDWTGEFICLDCISETDHSFSTGWPKHREACPRCSHRSTLYEALARRTL